MFKLIDIIKGGGSNPKLNKFLNRYVISKKEKTNLIKEIKNSKGGSSSTIYNRYYRFIKSMDDTVNEGLGVIFSHAVAFVKAEYVGPYNYFIASTTSGDITNPAAVKAFQFTPVVAGYIYMERLD